MKVPRFRKMPTPPPRLKIQDTIAKKRMLSDWLTYMYPLVITHNVVSFLLIWLPLSSRPSSGK